MSKIYAIQLLTTAVIGAYVSFVLLFVSRQNKLLDKLLGIFTLTMSLFCLLTFAISLNWAPDFVVLIRTFFPLYYFIPAVSYLYLRSYLRDATSLSRKDLIHALPIFLHLIYVSPLVYNLFIGDIQWTEMISKVDRQSYFFNYGPIPDRFHVVFRICIMLLYFSLSWRCYFSKLYRNFLDKNQNLYASSKRWILLYLSASTCNGLFSIIMKSRIFFLDDKHGWADGNFISFCLILVFDLLFAYAVLHPEILFGMPHFKSIMESGLPGEKKESLLPPDLVLQKEAVLVVKEDGNQAEQVAEMDIAIEHSGHEQELQSPKTVSTEQPLQESDITKEMQQLIVNIETYIKDNQPFRQEKFNIETISLALDVPQHHIAYLFKHVLKKSFVDYRNELRVNHVIQSFRKNLQHEITLESIGTDAGFGSKVSFFTVFKKHTGKTPGQYAEEMA